MNERHLRKVSQAKIFKFVELTDYDQRQALGDRPESEWFKKACDSGIQCDVLLVSGHYGGLYFGTSRYEMNPRESQEHSCMRTCDGILRHPKEVFLMGCNTLADKNKDSRTQQQYADVLAGPDHRMDRAMAERVAEARYGAVGSTFKDEARRIFAGVPRIYGFNSISPSGAHVRPLLRSYLNSIPDYAAHLDQINSDSGDNSVLGAALSNTSFVQTSGVGVVANDPGVPYRNQMCSLFDTSKPIPTRTSAAVRMMTGNDRFIFLNAVNEFLNSSLELIKQNKTAYASFQTIAQDPTTVSELDRLKASPKTSLSLKLDLMAFDLKLGRMTRAEFDQAAIGVLRPLLRKLNQVNADRICSAVNTYSLRLAVTYDDFSPADLAKRPALTATKCIRTSDERVTEAIVAQYDEMAATGRYTQDELRALLLALTNLPGQIDARYQVAQGALTQGDWLAPFAYGLLASVDPGDQESTAALAQTDIYQAGMVYNVFAHLPRQNALATSLLASLNRSMGMKHYRTQLFAIVRLLPTASQSWRQVAREIATLGPEAQAYFLGEIARLSQTPPAIVELSVQLFAHNTQMQAYPAYVLSRSRLTSSQAAVLASVIDEQGPKQYGGALARWVLSLQPRDVVPESARQYLHGETIGASCERLNGPLHCRNQSLWLD